MADQVEEFLLPLLKKIATENNFKTSNIQLKPTSTLGANYTSALFLATITEEGHEDLHLFIKVAVAVGHMFREMTDIDLYALERFSYTEMFTAFKDLEDRHRVADKHRFRSPKYYGSDSTPMREVLVLEDLSKQGFILQDRTKPVDWEYASAAIIQLARFHALSIACAHKNPEKNKKLLEKFNHKSFKPDRENFMFGAGIKKALEVVRDENREKLSKFFEKYDYAKFCEFFGTNRHPVLMHGDFRPSNMIHKYRKDETVELIPVDYQTLQYGSPAIDFLYFVFTALDTSGRAKYYNKILELYHWELGNALRRFGLLVENKLFLEEEFRQEVEERLPFAVQISVMIMPILLVSEDEAPLVENGAGQDAMINVVTGDLYNRRINEVIDEFIALGVM